MRILFPGRKKVFGKTVSVPAGEVHVVGTAPTTVIERLAQAGYTVKLKAKKKLNYI